MSRKERTVTKEATTIQVRTPEMVRLQDLNRAPYNPRVMPKEHMRNLKASLRRHGLVLNLVVQRSSPQHGPMVIVGGHQRVDAMQQLCGESGQPVPELVPAVVLDLTDQEAKKLNVSLNSQALQGEFDPYRLGLVLKDVQAEMVPIDYEAIGYTPTEVQELVQLTLPPEQQAEELERLAEIPEFARSVTLTLEFGTVAARDSAKELIGKLSKQGSQKPGDAVLAALKR